MTLRRIVIITASVMTCVVGLLALKAHHTRRFIVEGRRNCDLLVFTECLAYYAALYDDHLPMSWTQLKDMGFVGTGNKTAYKVAPNGNAVFDPETVVWRYGADLNAVYLDEHGTVRCVHCKEPVRLLWVNGHYDDAPSDPFSKILENIWLDCKKADLGYPRDGVASANQKNGEQETSQTAEENSGDSGVK